MKKNKKAFTLVELLVVISVIALLLGMLLPVLSKAREQARTIVCATNLRNYGIAVQMYANNNNDKLPNQYWLYSKSDRAEITGGSIAADGTLTLGSKYPFKCLWHYEGDVKPSGGLFKYLQDKNVNMCPTFKTFAMAGGLGGCPNSGEHKLAKGGGTMPFAPNFSYAGNAAIANWRTPELRIVDVKKAAQCMVFSEENLWPIAKEQRIKEDKDLTYSTAVLNDNLLVIENWATSQCDNIATYHKVSNSKRNDGYANCVFVDGHVDATWGKASYKAYFDYGQPYGGHENIWR